MPQKQAVAVGLAMTGMSKKKKAKKWNKASILTSGLNANG
jgi:hypothetical protein